MSSLVVNTNLSAIQTLNDLNATNNSEATAISRLSSGLQIENAATGPAQYVVSQSLQSEASGYGTAINNAQDGVSMIQTVSGALSQISSILQTMDQLALTSANGATETTTALAANQSEFTDLKKSINEIASTTTFGTTKLLIGKVTSANPTGTSKTAYTGSLQVGAFDTVDQQIALSISAVTAKALGFTGTPTAAVATSDALAGGKVTSAGTLKVTVTGHSTTLTLAATETIATVVSKLNAASTFGTYATAAVTKTTADKFTITSKATGTTASVKVTALSGVFAATTVKGTAGTKVSLTSTTDAKTAVKAVQTAIKTVDKIASNVGATQNELNAIVSNLTVGQQNLQAADSQLVDVNMAQEMTTFSTDQILMQSGVSMLAQAQQLPSLVLKLMGG